MVSTLQGGGRRGHRIDAEAAAGGHLIPYQKVVRPATSDHLVVSATGSHTHALTAEGHDASEDGTGRGTPIVAQCHGGNVGPLGTLRGDGSVTSGVPITLGFHLTQDPISGDVMPALGKKSGGNGLWTETTVRRLTPRECERLQGFPDDWTATSNGKPQADSPRYQQMGNAVAVAVFEWVGRRIAASERGAA